jgi:hypothetical protein
MNPVGAGTALETGWEITAARKEALIPDWVFADVAAVFTGRTDAVMYPKRINADSTV